MSKNIGLELKKGQIVRLLIADEEENVGRIFEVAEDNQWNKDFNVWGSVWLVGLYPPQFTHKDNLEVVK